MPGKFITFEGGEGTGKSTQAAMLALRLESLGLGVLLTREPGGSPGAEIIRHVLLSGAAKPLGPEAEAMLFAAARDDHVQCTILPALTVGQMGDLRPLRRFHARLSGQSRQGRSAAHQGARARFHRRSGARSDASSSTCRSSSGPGAHRAASRRRQAGPLRGGERGISRKASRSLSRACRRRAAALRRDRCQCAPRRTSRSESGMP